MKATNVQTLTYGEQQSQNRNIQAARRDAVRRNIVRSLTFSSATGGTRRSAILEYLALTVDNEITRIPVNRKWQIQVKNDPDIRRLLKEGKVKLTRLGRITCGQSYVTLV